MSYAHYKEYEDGHVRRSSTRPHPVLEPVGEYVIERRREVRFEKPETKPIASFPHAILMALNVLDKHVFPGIDPSRVARKRKSVAKQKRRDDRIAKRTNSGTLPADADSGPTE